MPLPRFTIGRLLLIVAAFGVGLAAFEGNHVWFRGMSLMTIMGLLGAALGAGPDEGRPAAVVARSNDVVDPAETVGIPGTG